MRTFQRDGVRSVLVLRLYFVGDVLLSTPVLAALRAGLPDARIDVLVKRRAAPVLERSPHVDEVILYDEPERYHNPVWMCRLAARLRGARYDLAVDLTGDHRSSLLLAAADPGFRTGLNHCGMGFLLDRRIPYRSDGHVVDHLLRSVEALGLGPEDRAPVLVLGEEEVDASRGILRDAGIDPPEPFIALSPGANWPPRRWPAERFGALASRIRTGLGLRSAVLGSRSDVDIATAVVEASRGDATSLAGKTGLRTLAGVASLATVFVGNDSGPMHVAASQGTPVVALFGPNTPRRYAPRGAPSEVLWSPTDCAPCAQKRCVRASDRCMERISVDDAYEAVASLLADGGRP